MQLSSDYLNLIVEVAVTVYAFLLGLPALVSQILLPDDLRRMSRKNYTPNIMRALLPMTFLLLLIVLLSFLANVLAESPSVLRASAIAATLLFAGMLVFTLQYTWRHLALSQGYRARIVGVIQDKAIAKFRKDGKLDPAYLEDLEYLGVSSKAGAETRTVIEALENLLNEVAEGEESQYGSGQLLPIIDSLCNTVANSVEPGSRRNMVDVLTLYKSILMSLNFRTTEDNKLIYGNETRKIKDSTTRIALAALKRDYIDMMPLVLNVLTLIPRSSDKLFDIGLLALARGQFQIATNVLAEIMDRDNKDYLKMNNYLGLAAHLYFAGGAARKYVKHSLKNNRIGPSPAEMEDAREYHYILSNFATVDMLEGMKQELG
ncbi:MAG: hypothetical protein KDC66_18050 [Phaeodactylibacter sp.]|nr:hypothetical protein [Phaeodactylibacter sp.]MCB9274893.1 hypothetical protein [Lewinellaceae bacterium]